MISTSERRAEHLFAGRNPQQTTPLATAHLLSVCLGCLERNRACFFKNYATAQKTNYGSFISVLIVIGFGIIQLLFFVLGTLTLSPMIYSLVGLFSSIGKLIKFVAAQ